jgi:hypothetical protein
VNNIGFDHVDDVLGDIAGMVADALEPICDCQ